MCFDSLKRTFCIVLSITAVASCSGSGTFSESLLPFEDQKSQLWGYKKPGGTVVIPPRFHVAGEFSSYGLAAVADDSGWQYIDTEGNTIIRPFVFENGPDYFKDGLARFIMDGKFGFFNERGQIVISPRFDFAAPFSESLAAICIGCRKFKKGEHSWYDGGVWGYIDRLGNIAIPSKFEKARPFEHGRARVMLGGKWVYINKKGEAID